MLVDARKAGEIPWDWIEDRLRRPRAVAMWADLADFAETARRAYRRDIWDTQPGYLECWLEKDALSGIFEDLLDPYGVTLKLAGVMTAGIRSAMRRAAMATGAG